MCHPGPEGESDPMGGQPRNVCVTPLSGSQPTGQILSDASKAERTQQTVLNEDLFREGRLKHLDKHI